jgi:hypothetical protein
MSEHRPKQGADGPTKSPPQADRKKKLARFTDQPAPLASLAWRANIHGK